ncbi:MAG TPA: YihY/virulence factor BrkB family protein [Candidatus Limnocylindria bacterium]|nr:YihY/virulence factor BrkB family protein [Candidatus Limnocylindria bacterium]
MSQAALGTLLTGLWTRVRREVAERDLADAPFSERAVLLPIRIAVVSLAGLFRHQVLVHAAALTYISIVSLVPTLAVAFAMFKAFGGLEQARRVLMPKIMAYVAIGSQALVEAKIQEFVDNVQSGTLGSVGIVVLLLVVVFLLSAIEYSFNQIFESPRPRSFLHRVAAYWTLVTVTPTALLIGVGMPATLKRFSPQLWAILDGTTLGVLLGLVVPLVLVWLGFALLYYFIPAARVAPHAAVAGAAVGGSLWWIAVHGYAYYSVLALEYSKIYGSLGVVPILLLWIWLTWLIVLFGAEVAAAVQYTPTAPLVADVRPASQSLRELLALRLMAAVARRYDAGEPPATIDDLCADTHAPSRLAVDVVQQLRDAGLLLESTDGRLVASMDPKRLSPADILHALRHHGDDSVWAERDATTEALARWQAEQDAAAGHAPRITLLDLPAAASSVRR